MEVAETLPLDALLHLRFQTDRGAIEAETVGVWDCHGVTLAQA